MRPGQNKRGRGRNHNPNNMGGGGQHNNNSNNNGGGNNRGPRPPHRMQTFDSNGPSVKIRGNAYQVFERYIALAREASSSGDRIAAENLYQHAEHYYRIMQANGEQMAPRPMTPADTEMNGGEGEGDGEFNGNGNGNGNGQQQGQPQAAGQPQPMIPEGADEEAEGQAV